jgi:dCMP deaminase
MKNQDKIYMSLAETLSAASHCIRAKVGCVIVKDDTIISFGYNGTPSGFDNKCEDDSNKTNRLTLHAESNAIMKCARHGISCNDAILYITLMPCFDCSKLIIQSGIKTVYYKYLYRDHSGVELLKQSKVNVFQLV